MLWCFPHLFFFISILGDENYKSSPYKDNAFQSQFRQQYNVERLFLLNKHNKYYDPFGV